MYHERLSDQWKRCRLTLTLERKFRPKYFTESALHMSRIVTQTKTYKMGAVDALAGDYMLRGM